MLCNNCGNQIPDNSITCPNCGTPTTGGTQVPNGTPAAKVPFAQQADASINFIALILAVVGLVCVFPAKVVANVSIWGVKTSEGVSIIGHYGIFMVALLAITAILLFLKKSNSAVIPVAINAVFCIIKMIQESNAPEVKEVRDMGLDASVTFNIFFWLVLILSILDVVAILVLPKVMGNKQ